MQLSLLLNKSSAMCSVERTVTEQRLTVIFAGVCYTCAVAATAVTFGHIVLDVAGVKLHSSPQYTLLLYFCAGILIAVFSVLSLYIILAPICLGVCYVLYDTADDVEEMNTMHNQQKQSMFSDASFSDGDVDRLY